MALVAQVVHGLVKILLNGCVGPTLLMLAATSAVVAVNSMQRKDSQVVFHYFLEWLYSFRICLKNLHISSQLAC